MAKTIPHRELRNRSSDVLRRVQAGKQEHITLKLERLDLLLPDSDVFRTAGMLPGSALRSLDALHVAAALRWEADGIVTYDERKAKAARGVGLRTAAPS